MHTRDDNENTCQLVNFINHKSNTDFTSRCFNWVFCCFNSHNACLRGAQQHESMAAPPGTESVPLNEFQ